MQNNLRVIINFSYGINAKVETQTAFAPRSSEGVLIGLVVG